MIINKTNVIKSAFKLIFVLSVAFSFNVNAGSDFDSLWRAADELRQQAAQMRNEWRDTAKILGKAKAEYGSGNIESALALVAKAHEQSADAIAQADREKTAWQARVIK